MLIAKIYEGHSTDPKYLIPVRVEKDSLLVTYPTGKPDYKREARWIYLNNIRIDWVRDFIGD